MIAKVRYRVATYAGEITIQCDPEDDDDIIIAKAKKIVTRQAGGSLPSGYEYWKIAERY
jgi:hypothetical protein